MRSAGLPTIVYPIGFLNVVVRDLEIVFPSDGGRVAGPRD
jgi:hypothetical protein